MRFRELQEWLDWQATLHPEEIELGLARISEVWRHLRPEGLQSKVVTVAGTNGKGSCVAMLEAVYRQAGYSVGAYTSPHLIRYNERVRINGHAVTDDRLCAAFERVDSVRNGVTLTYFEFGTLAALDIFADESPDLTILEVGLGGRLDAVNIIDPDLALITTIDLDHTDWLGTTKEQIGWEKAGIMRAAIPVVLGAEEMPGSVFRHATALGVELYQFNRNFHIEARVNSFTWFGHAKKISDVALPALKGNCQLRNAASVLMVTECLAQTLPVTKEAINRAFQWLRLPGRLQIIEVEPQILLDVAHNPQAVRELRDMLQVMPVRGRMRAIFTLLSDKDLASIAEIMGPLIEHWYLVGTKGDRGQSAELLRVGLVNAGIKQTISCHQSVEEALATARSESYAEDRILIFGSFLLIGEALGILQYPHSLETEGLFWRNN